MNDTDPSHPPPRDAFELVAASCESSLASQHGAEAGRFLAELIRSLGTIAEISSDRTTDRFDLRKAAEAEVDDLLVELATAHSASLRARFSESSDTDGASSANRSQKSYLFVYGTLKRGFSRADWMRGQRFVGEARTTPKYRMFDCGSYPGLVESPDDGASIEGEIWGVDGECLARLDEVEGVELNLYTRQQIEMQSPFDQDAVETYIFQRSVVGMVDCGVVWTPD